ncbi:glycine cleavage system aminomethyltransferase GcvT [Sphingomonas piscis]|uniref:aminomethyltransferase n=1 Tax=Sphingomonas piscis TaxID=2714943 RepID=A0A6G7YLT6_9SPHN|nr:glycine cleavage system aminomethyltransferase GcvT [Sphingomonas piscis]QIK77710.1 glycine cleavage system aminomethyltransferase GcvT [Sphingomonas piscis]
MSRDVHNGPTDQHTQARGEPYRGDPQGGEDGFEEAGPRKLALDGWHRAKGGRMVPFAGYEMPVQYEGIMAEHLWTREHAGLFDVSHMGQLMLTGTGVAEALEALLPGDISALKPGRIRYSLLLTNDGGIIDDLMVTNVSQGDREAYYMVVNGATKWDDIAHLREHLPDEITLNHLEDRGLLALQGPEAAAVIGDLFPGVPDEIGFMQGTSREWNGVAVGFGRSGYTGEDGFELSVPLSQVEQLAEALVADERVKPIGLGARDSLRLEAGLPLYGHDLDTNTTPVMADLGFAISKKRREQGGFAGATRILSEIENGPIQKRVGIDVEGRQPVREGALILDGEGNEVGRITSGGFSPSLGRPIAMGYVATALAEPGTALKLEQRSKLFDGRVVPMPFVPHRYHRKGAAQ